MTKSQSTLELAKQIWRDPGIQFVDPDNDKHWRQIMERLAALIEAYTLEREAGVQYEEAAWWAERKTRTTPLDETESYRLEVLRKRESAILRMQPTGEANEQQGGE